MLCLPGGRAHTNSSGIANVDTYNSSLTKSTATALPFARYNAGAVGLGEYAIIAGGYTSNSSNYGTAYAYNASKVQTELDPLTIYSSSYAAMVGFNLFNKYAMFVCQRRKQWFCSYSSRIL